MKKLVACLLLLAALLLAAIYAYNQSTVSALPGFDQVKDSYKKSDVVLLDRHGKIIHELRLDPGRRSLDWISLKDISPSLVKVVIHSEDKRFYEHHGVDWFAVCNTTVKNLFSKSKRGASTISMQLVSIIDEKLKPKTTKRTLRQKWNQISAAKDLEKTWAKAEILEAYLNLIFFRGELQGTSSASRGLFDKDPSGLNEDESVILASLIRSPNASINNVAARACLLSQSLKSNSTCDELEKLANNTFTKNYFVKQKNSIAPHVAFQLLKYDTNEVVSTLDGELQRFAIEMLNEQLRKLQTSNVNDGAVLVVENKSGDILAYVGNSGKSSSAKYVDGVRAKRQAGSTLKPFLYEMAIEKKLLTAASMLNDSPLSIPTPVGLYSPQDYDTQYKGFVSLRTSLSGSLNIPAIKTLMLLGPESFVQMLVELGIEDLNEGEYYGPSLALGSADVSLYELVNAYKTLSNKGIWSELRLEFKDKKIIKKKIMDENAVFIISDILSDRGARSITFGFENPLATRFWTAVKTGTSKDMRDNWCIGYSEKYTVGVWIGNFSGEAMWNVSGMSGAAPIWMEIMNYLHHSVTSKAPKPPSGVILEKIQFQNNAEPSKNEWFVMGSEPGSLKIEQTAMPNTNQRPYIVYPVDGTVIAIDPDIPEENNTIFFEAKTGSKKLEWHLNNEKIGSSANSTSWVPKEGSYILSLIDEQKKLVDSVKFTVK